MLQKKQNLGKDLTLKRESDDGDNLKGLSMINI